MIELVVDNFAGGGGASYGIEAAIGRPIDIAINHDRTAIRMHQLNHPRTRHYCQDIWTVRPSDAAGGRPVGLAWFSPDCKHFSKAKGGKPVEKKIRDLAWVVIRWAASVRPRIIILENVEEFRQWCPLSGDGRPSKECLGATFDLWVSHLRSFGYAVEHRELRACDYGDPTSRKRLFLIARCDGEPIVWPEPSHGPSGSGRIPYRTAAECIDWSQACPSIFERPRPLAENTMRRIAQGVKRYVIDAAEPFVVTCNHQGEHFRGQRLGEPFKTVTGARDAHGLVTPFLVPRYGERPGQEPRTHSAQMPLPTIVPTGNQGSLVATELAPVLIRYNQERGNGAHIHDVRDPLGTLTAENRFGLVSAFLSKHFGGPNGKMAVGQSLRQPSPTVTARDHSALTTAFLTKFRGTCRHGQDVRRPMPAVTAQGTHIGEVRAFLIKYYKTGVPRRVDNPLDSITAKHRFGLVEVSGALWQIADIGMRMLQPRELFRAQGFPDSYIIEGFTKSEQTRLCGNSVCPGVARALVAANFAERRVRKWWEAA